MVLFRERWLTQYLGGDNAMETIDRRNRNQSAYGAENRLEAPKIASQFTSASACTDAPLIP